MSSKFCKGWILALLAYVLAYWALLNLAFGFIYAIAVSVVLWAGLAGYKLYRLTSLRAYSTTAAEWDREAFGFWLGAMLSSIVLTALFLITPVGIG